MSMVLAKRKNGNGNLSNAGKKAKKALKVGMEIGAALGDMALTDNQKRVANRFARPVKSALESAIDVFMQDRSMVPHPAGAPVSTNFRIRNSVPKFQQSKGNVVVMHREMITGVNVVSGDTVQTGRIINPFNPYIFPWLATIAGNYDKYKIRKLSFQYVPYCATSQVGRIILAWDPAGTDAVPDFYDLPNMHSVASQFWSPCSLDIPPSAVKYIGEQAGDSGAARDVYNHGTLFVGLLGGDTNAAGEIYVTYVVELMNAQPATGLASVSNTTFTSGNTVLTTIGTVDGFVPNVVSGKLQIPAGVWKIEVNIIGTVLGGYALNSGGGLTTVGTTTVISAAATNLISYSFIKSNGGVTAVMAPTCTFTTLSSSQFRLTRVDPLSYTSSLVIV